MTAFLIFILLPIVLIAASFFIKPLVQKDEKRGDPFGGNMAAGGFFGAHGLEPDSRSVPEETTPVRFRLEDVNKGE